MKKSVLLLTLLLSFSGYSQDKEFKIEAKEGMTLVRGNENKITTNHPLLENYLEEWKTAAEQGKANYLPKYNKIKAIVFDDLPPQDYWGVTKSNEIVINIRFLEYPYLTRLMVWQSLGYYYELEFVEGGRFIMSTTWKMDPESENWAFQHYKRGHQQKTYFGKLAANLPLEFYKKI